MSTTDTGTAPGAARHVDAGHGLQWWGDAFRAMFGDLSRMGIWVLMGLVAQLLTVFLHFVPLLGSLAAVLLWVFFSGGFVVSARQAAQGRPTLFGDLFAGFGAQGGSLAAVGLLFLVGSAVIGSVMMLIGLGGFFAGLASASFTPDGMDLPVNALLSIGAGALIALLLVACLFVPLSMAVWLAPALVLLRGAQPVDALRLSLSACGRNLGALTVYGLAFIGLAIVATIPVLIGWVVLTPLCCVSTYYAYRDLFEQGVEVLDAAAPPAGAGAA